MPAQVEAPALNLFYRIRCRDPCQSVHTFSGKPCATSEGAWPKVQCKVCGINARIGKFACIKCAKQLRLCRCAASAEVGPPGVPRGGPSILERLGAVRGN